MITVRKAVKSDSHFLASIILLAENTGHEITSYTKLFNKTNEELLPIFERIVEGGMEGYPLTFKSFLVACVNDIPSAAIAIYKEGEFGDSNHLTTGALMTNFDRKSMALAFGFLKNHAELSITKSLHSLQIDCVATLPEQRGKGLLKLLIAEAERYAKQKDVGQLEIQVWKKNESAISAYSKIGFTIKEEKLSSQEDNNGKVLMIKNL